MVGTQLYSVPGLPWLALVMIAAGLLACAGSTVLPQPGLAVVGLPLVCVGVVKLLLRPKVFNATLTDEGLVVQNPPVAMSYADIEAIHGWGRPADLRQTKRRSFLIVLSGADLVVRLPPKLNIDSETIYQFLLERLPVAGSSRIQPLLQPYVDRMRERFGPEKVFVWRGRNRRVTRYTWEWPLLFAALLFGAIAGCIVASATTLNPKDVEAWYGLGIVFGIFGFVGFIATLAAPGPDSKVTWKKEAKRPGLAMSPLGLAMIQGDQQGELTWNELRKATFRSKGSGFALSSSDLKIGIILEVEGAEVVIVDTYDRPLWQIYRQIMKFWKGQELFPGH